jgi:predicted nucleic acid-binding protein
MTFVLDASVTLCWLLADGKTAANAYAHKVLEALVREDTQALVPMIWGLEVSNVIAKAESMGRLNEAQSEAFLEMLAGIEIEVDSATFENSLSGTLQLARRHSLSAYDASYLEVALREGLMLATLDDGLRKAAKKAGVQAFEDR